MVVVMVGAGLGVRAASVRFISINRECWKMTWKDASSIDVEGTYPPAYINPIVVSKQSFHVRACHKTNTT